MERGLSVLITTHNPALLDALPAHVVPGILFCYRDAKVGDSRLVRLEDIPDFPKLAMQGPLGRLLTQRTIDHFVKQAEDPEQRKRRRLAIWSLDEDLQGYDQPARF